MKKFIYLFTIMLFIVSCTSPYKQECCYDWHGNYVEPSSIKVNNHETKLKEFLSAKDTFYYEGMYEVEPTSKYELPSDPTFHKMFFDEDLNIYFTNGIEMIHYDLQTSYVSNTLYRLQYDNVHITIDDKRKKITLENIRNGKVDSDFFIYYKDKDMIKKNLKD